MLPCPWYIVVYTTLSHIVFTETYSATLIYCIQFAANTLIQCIEEICLVIISKDFRKLVKSQFIKTTQTHAVVATVYVSPALNQQGTRQFNIQRDNLVLNN